MAFQATAEDVKLVEYLAQFYADPLGYVLAVFPWKTPGTSLADEEGPDKWQIEFLEELGRQVKACDGNLQEVIQMAVASGHGIGKGACVAWIIKWFMTTRPNPQVVVTANTSTQLATKTWRELAKWNNLAIDGHWFEWTATAFRFKPRPETHFSAAIPWSENNSEAFAGTHEKYVLLIFDEASKIADVIWEVASGAMTTKGAIWLVFGNPTRNTGRFHACFHKFRHRWKTYQIDSRTCKKANKVKAQQEVDDYGEDSDYVRIRVKGMFPRASSEQFISTELVQKAFDRAHKPDAYRHAAKVLAVDVARFGDDSTVPCLRQGVKFLWSEEHRNYDTMQTAQMTARHEDEEKPDAVFIDVVGVGAGVVDRGRQLGRIWIEHNGAHSSSKRRYSNKRAECWGDMRDWLETADLSDVPKDERQIWMDDLTGPEFTYDRVDRIILEKKEDMKERGLHSPDHGDALAMTFTQRVIPRQMLEDEYDYQEVEKARHRADQNRSSICGY